MSNKNYIIETYNIVWNTQSKDASESMPLGGHDIGCNVWVENNEILVYMAQSGAFDEEGRMAKAGRLRINISPNPFKNKFKQELKLQEGFIEITGEADGKVINISLWVDVYRSVIHTDINSDVEVNIKYTYETWRGENSSFANKDVIEAENNQILFYHKNYKSLVFNSRIELQGLQSIADEFPDVEKNRTFGGLMKSGDMVYTGANVGKYAENVFMGYSLETKYPVKSQNISVYLYINQINELQQWKDEIENYVIGSDKEENPWIKTKKWWECFWDRSHIYINQNKSDKDDIDWQVGRNYQLFRYMLACNAYGEYPTKFNGGLFTIDPIYWGTIFDSVCPDDRDWGGLIFTAQNQRLVYWPMIKSGDFDMMNTQFDFYNRILNGVKKRTEYFFNIKDSACFPEQLDANGLSVFYGKFGLDYPLHVRYHHVEALEFGFMIIKYAKTSGNNISKYMDLICSLVNFYDKTYNNLDIDGKRIIFPSTALETYHGAKNIDKWGREGAEAANYNEVDVAVTNPADVIAALQDVLRELLTTEYGTVEQRKGWEKLLRELPPIPKEIKNGHEVISPCELPKKYIKLNCEFPQMNVTYPYNAYGINKPDLQLAIDTYNYAWDCEDQKDHVSWHLAGIYAARIGLGDEAQKYMRLKLADSGRRFPAFWGPGHDYTPDHNWGGSGMIGVQEMLMQSFDKKIHLLPAWPKNIDVNFKLWADDNTYIEADYTDGVLNYTVTPKSREEDVIG